jgi:putative ABC transport system permease protein
MRAADILRHAWRAIAAQRLRAGLILLAMSIGAAAVIVLTSLGESARQYVTGQFMALGANLVIVLPGRSETTGGHPPLFGETPRDLTLDDAEALLRARHIVRIAPLILGASPVSWGGLEREVTVIGATAELREVRRLELSQGHFLPSAELERAMPVCVLGEKLRQELFGNRSALGEWLSIGDRRFRVIGVLTAKGHSVGIDFDDTAVIPVASAQMLFDTPGLFRILIEARSRTAVADAVNEARDILRARHEGEDDVTLITQDSVVGAFDKVLRALTFTVGGIAAISMLVAGILVMNVMLVSVTQRTPEIGLLKALGADGPLLRRLFLTEAALLSLGGAALGLLFGWLGIAVLQARYPDFPFAAPLWAPLTAVLISLAAGLGFGVLPASRAARLDPVLALSRR